MAMTVAQHDKNWLEAAQAIQKLPKLIREIEINNAILIMKELYEIGKMDRDDYAKSLAKLLNMSGFRQIGKQLLNDEASWTPDNDGYTSSLDALLNTSGFHQTG